MTMQAPVAYDPDAEAPRWNQALEEWFPDESVRRYVQRLSGHGLSGDPQGDHIFVVHYGDGRNGKGTFMRSHKHVLGDYYITPDKSLLVQRNHDQHATVKARLYRTRLAVASETDQRERLNEAQVKNLTGGDPINARHMREDEWEFEPTHSLWLQTNYLPEISGSDTGIWSRIRVVPWTVCFEGHAEGDLDSRLASEASGILNWMIQGCRDWQESGLEEPRSVVRATLDYRATEDVLAHFAKDTGLTFAAGSTLVDSILKRRIDQWAASEAVAHPSARTVNAWMKANGCREGRENYTTENGTTSKRKVWEGAQFTAPSTTIDMQPRS
jgi:putative DNA primase/helicase